MYQLHHDENFLKFFVLIWKTPWTGALLRVNNSAQLKFNLKCKEIISTFIYYQLRPATTIQFLSYC